MPSQLEIAIYSTIRYFDLFDLPLTSTQLWQCLIVEDKSETGMPAGRHVRWAGHAHYSLREVQEALNHSQYLTERLDTKWGYYFLAGKEYLVRERLSRHTLAQDKWKTMKRAARYLAYVPFVKALAGSGSLALDNTKPSSDLDVFVITTGKRIWLARLGLLIVSQLLGRRRKYWMGEAPDMICLNHYVTDSHLSVPAAIHNVYTAVQYTLHVPIYGGEVVREFQDRNGAWIRQHVMSPEMPNVPHKYEVALPRWAAGVKRSVEAFLLEPIGNVLEKAAEKIQRAVIARHAGRRGRIAISDHELAFHPDTKVPGILAAFYQDPGQQSLL